MNIRTVALAGLALTLVGGAIYPLVNRKDPTPAAQASAPEAVPTVRTARVETQMMTRTLRLTGTLKSGSEATLSPKQGGKVLAVLVSEGQAVRRGQILVRLDTSDILRQSEQAQAGVSAARANLEKARTGGAGAGRRPRN